MILTFTVYGVALAKGNHTATIRRTKTGRAFAKITETNRNVGAWQQLVREGASHALGSLDPLERRVLSEGVRLSIAFVLPRPLSLPKKISAHLKAPDVDKLARAVADALTGVAYRDDCQVCELIAAKRYAAIGEAAHVTRAGRTHRRCAGDDASRAAAPLAGARGGRLVSRPRRIKSDAGVTATALQAAALAAAKDTQCWWFVSSEIELAALLHGEVSPAIRAQAADLLRRTIEEHGGR